MPRKPPRDFDAATALVPDLIASVVLENRTHNLTTGQVDWFARHCDLRYRWLWANDPRWRKRHQRKDRARDEAYMWIGHWADGFTLRPDTYMARHPMAVYA
jgi:hypothetical protein